MKMVKKRGTVLVLFTFLSALLLTVSFCFAAPDPSIKDWGSPPGSPPPWQTTDIWVDNNGNGTRNEVGEPSKGMTNRLFAKVRNLGTSTANNVTVRFAYAPYGAWGWASFTDFKEIAAVTGVNLAAAGDADAEKTIEVAWDLSNLSESNGGQWGGYTVGDFDHFCVWVRIEYSGDSNNGNNNARNNFVNVQTTFGKSLTLKLIVPNPRKNMANARLTFKGVPENWQLAVRGIDNYKEFALKPGEYRLVTLTLTPPAQLPPIPLIKQNVDVSLSLDNKVIGGVTFVVTVEKEKTAAFVPADGVLSPYLIGMYDLRGGARTVFQIINPTAKYLRVMAAFFDDNEKPLKCVYDKLSPNDLLEINALRLRLPANFGVVKIVSLNEKENVPETGLVGYQRRVFKGGGVTESALQSIPSEILKDDLKYIREICKEFP